MGLNLGSKPKSKPKSEPKKGDKWAMDLKSKPTKKAATGKSKVKKAVAQPVAVEADDEVITAENPEVTSEVVGPTVARVQAFEYGLVNPALRDAVNTYWKKSPESDLFITLLSTVRVHEGTYFGSIFMKSSFVRKKGGSALI